MPVAWRYVLCFAPRLVQGDQRVEERGGAGIILVKKLLIRRPATRFVPDRLRWAPRVVDGPIFLPRILLHGTTELTQGVGTGHVESESKSRGLPVRIRPYARGPGPSRLLLDRSWMPDFY